MKHLHSLQAVASGWRPQVRHVQVREDRSVGLYKGIRDDVAPHVSLRERIRNLERRLRRSTANDSTLYDQIAVYQTELDARLAGNPTEDFQWTTQN